MSAVIAQRRAAKMDGEFIVFLIGMRVNRWWKVLRWLRVAAAMPRMLKELEEHPDLGYLGSESWFGRTTIMLSYWRSMEHLHAYATSRNANHLPAWKRFNEIVGTSGDVGVWHETYRSRPGDYEAVYVNMPEFGLAKVGSGIPAEGAYARAASRLEAPTRA